ncbi:DUF2852 domain-containing protein [Pontivivens insulae]|uniref:DUF2852 domain-containing protein n=1 Tax=Pontivivens insulae TaxID=1639689 RepID=A0A2R8AAM6_9RHOB|nr:DUF2852 domain-containing protein [Pontivivens insulae]RED13167.1 uncharacterized protein DUF2852 [Pontivivens insulae]SPF29259.1 hypothetical protein POI8812_01566 [Pontivivens insulae]
MSTATAYLNNAETWLDERGKGAWIAAMVLGFIFFWPIGLALLFYMIWSKRMSGTSCARRSNRRMARRYGPASSGNAAFDAYRDDTIRRLEEEQAAFHQFMDNLRNARDKAEFDQFMNERRSAPKADVTADEAEMAEDQPAR